MSGAALDRTEIRSAFYEGWITHRRRAPIEHSFRYPILIPLLDLAELPRLLDIHPLWSARRPAPAWIRPADLLGRGRLPPADAARAIAARELGVTPAGPVAVLTHPRYFGVGFNPIRVYFLSDVGGALEAAIAEVTNTPRGDRHAYSFARAPGDPEVRGSAAKRMPVSPFMSTAQTYQCRIGEPGERLTIAIRNVEAGQVVLEATMSLRRIGFSRALLTRALTSYPTQTASTLVRIYSQAARLRARGLNRQAPGSGGRRPSNRGRPRSRMVG